MGVDAVAFDEAFVALSYERFTGAFRDLVERAAALTAELLATVPDQTISTLDELRLAGWRMGLVSNVTSETPDRWRAFSSGLGVAKPEPGIYLAACPRLDVPPAECFYLGDGADDELAAASALGLYADGVPARRP